MSDNFYSIPAHTMTNYSQGADFDVVNTIRSSGTQKEQLKKVAKEFEAILVSKMLTQMDKTVDRENSLFGESKYEENFKSILFNQIGRDVANSPISNIGFAKQLYQQMERSVPDETLSTKDITG
ncbi:TPA: rod-binding protein [Candidatus Galligastranaerophilus faecipullorum]|nr:rod-binding protein [Candidatus Galligastranaerophilus faecipullorum]